jgi:calcineurin-like phosphoesterase family protein
MREVFFTSDTHFGHRAVLKYSNRPFIDVQEMDEEMIRRWNAIVSPSDVVYHLGDVSFHRQERTLEILAALHGTIHLIKGNHDRANREVVKRFASIENYAELTMPGCDAACVNCEQKIVLCHYPLMTWNKSHYGSWHLHGHSHGNLKAPKTTRLDVGVDCHAYAPLSFEEIRKEMATRSYLAVDHHAERGHE